MKYDSLCFKGSEVAQSYGAFCSKIFVSIYLRFLEADTLIKHHFITLLNMSLSSVWKTVLVTPLSKCLTTFLN